MLPPVSQCSMQKLSYLVTYTVQLQYLAKTTITYVHYFPNTNSNPSPCPMTVLVHPAKKSIKSAHIQGLILYFRITLQALYFKYCEVSSFKLYCYGRPRGSIDAARGSTNDQSINHRINQRNQLKCRLID